MSASVAALSSSSPCMLAALPLRRSAQLKSLRAGLACSLLAARQPATNNLSNKLRSPAWLISDTSRTGLLSTLCKSAAEDVGVVDSKVPGTRKNPWDQHDLTQRFDSLKENTTVDVCVVGAGIAGLTTAYLLAKQGDDTYKLMHLIQNNRAFALAWCASIV